MSVQASRLYAIERLLVVFSIISAIACAATAFSGTITGQAFRDYNSNAVNNSGEYVVGTSAAATNIGISGMTVRAFDSAGSLVGETTTAADGTYSLAVSVTGKVRVEFSNSSGFQPSFEGTQSQTSVEFVDAAGAASVHYAVM